jgi:hypothetical protein
MVETQRTCCNNRTDFIAGHVAILVSAINYPTRHDGV